MFTISLGSKPRLPPRKRHFDARCSVTFPQANQPDRRIRFQNVYLFPKLPNCERGALPNEEDICRQSLPLMTWKLPSKIFCRQRILRNWRRCSKNGVALGGKMSVNFGFKSAPLNNWKAKVHKESNWPRNIPRFRYDGFVKSRWDDGFAKSSRCKARKNWGVKRTYRYAADGLFTKPSDIGSHKCFWEVSVCTPLTFMNWLRTREYGVSWMRNCWTNLIRQAERTQGDKTFVGWWIGWKTELKMSKDIKSNVSSLVAKLNYCRPDLNPFFEKTKAGPLKPCLYLNVA